MARPGMGARQVSPVAEVAKSYAVNRRGESEGLWYPLYDFQTYAAAGQSVLTFFAVPVGQGATAKTQADTNMTNAALLPAPQAFLCTGVEVVFMPAFATAENIGKSGVNTAVGDNWNDVNAVARAGLLRFYVGAKDYLVDAPIGVFPPSFRLGGAAALSDATTAAANLFSQIDYAVMTGQPYDISPIFIPSSQNFRVTLEWPNGVVACPSTVAGRVGIRLNGFIYRLSQ